MLRAYTYDKVTLLANGSLLFQDASELPDNAIPGPFPGLAEFQAARANEARTGWDVIEDYRAATVVDADGNTVVIADVGPLPNGCRVVTENDPDVVAKRLAEARDKAMETLRLRKWAAKNAGIIVNGIAIDTDDTGQSTIMGAVLNVMIDPTFTAMWKTSAVDEHGQSVWVEIDATIIMALSKAMTQYTEACFAVEAMKQAEIAACGTVEDITAWLETSLDTGWPSREITLGG